MASPRYTRHIRPDDIQPPEPTVLTQKQKWGNVWYYHKWHILFALAAVSLAVALVCSFVSVVKPDYQITLLSPYPRSSNALEALQDRISDFGKDRNGDGRVVVDVQQYNLATNDELLIQMNPHVNMAGSLQLQGDAQTGGTVIFITDDFDALQQRYSFFADLNAPYAPLDVGAQGVYYIPWTDCAPLSQTEWGTVTALDGKTDITVEEEFSDTVFCIRTITGTTLEEDEYFQQYYSDCLELLRALTETAIGA